MEKIFLNYLKKTSPVWFYLNTRASNGELNMLCDEYLLDSFVTGKIQYPVFRIYGWSESTISLGRNQKLNEATKLLYGDLPVVRRMTGGQGVLHGLVDSELTYSLVFSSCGAVKKLYYEIGQILIFFLKRLKLSGSYGLSENYLSSFDCFNSHTTSDIVVNDIKVIGSAQKIVRDTKIKTKFVFQHGSIKLDLINRLSGGCIDFTEAAHHLKYSFESLLDIQFLDYSLEGKDYDYCLQ